MKTNTVKDLGIITQIILQKCFKKSFRTSKVILPLRHDSNEAIEKCSQNEYANTSKCCYISGKKYW